MAMPGYELEDLAISPIFLYCKIENETVCIFIIGLLCCRLGKIKEIMCLKKCLIYVVGS